MSKEIEFTISPTGELFIETKGFQGTACEKEVDSILSSMELKASTKKKKKEYYNNTSSKINQKG